MLKLMDKIGKVIFDVCSSAIVVGGAMVIYQKIFLNSVQIGEMIMDRLKNLDQVAYVRFASVYRQFKDTNAFLEELNKLLKEENK